MEKLIKVLKGRRLYREDNKSEEKWLTMSVINEAVTLIQNNQMKYISCYI